MNVSEYLKKVDEVNEAGPYRPEWESLCGHETPAWFRKAKFGIFIHWGVFSVPEAFSEWYPRHMYRADSPEHEHFKKTYGDFSRMGYKDLIPLFTAEKFDAEAWMKLFKEAGAKYVVPVAEHHDGFQMYQSELSRWNVAKMGPKRDTLSELRAAAEKYGLVFCASSHRAEHYWFMNGGREYESDVNDPAYDDFYGPAVLTPELKAWVPDDLYRVTIDSPRMKEHCENWLARTCELVDRYRPKVVYFDWWINNGAFRPYLKKFAAYYYNRAEEWGEEVTIDYKHSAFVPDAATFDVERGQLREINPRPWQTDTAIACNSWSYTADNEFKDGREIVCDLVDIVSKNGCLLLNVGPRANGEICEEEAKVLRTIGAWLKVNGEGIYDTVCWKVYGEGPTQIPEGQFSDTSREPFTSADIRYTYRRGILYAFVMSAKEGLEEVALTALRGGDFPAESVCPVRAEILGMEDVPVTFAQERDALRLRFGKKISSDTPVCVRLTLR